MLNRICARTFVSAALVTVALSACSSPPKPVESLTQARMEYKEASKDEKIARHAPEELDQARNALGAAERRWKKKEDLSSIEHYSYLASQRVKIASYIAESNEMDRELEGMDLARRNVTLDLREAELKKARLDAEKMQKEMKNLQGEKTERGMVLTLGDVLFASGQAKMAPGATRNIEKIAAFMRSYPKRQAVIEGHTDSMGDEEYNLNLSRERAFSVRQALVSQGISASRISTQGFGESLPVASNASSAGRQENRRVEVIFPDLPTQMSGYEE